MDEKLLQNPFPYPNKKLVGSKILIIRNAGADWIKEGKTYPVKRAADGKLFIAHNWWHCCENPCRGLFQVVEPAGKIRYLSGTVDDIDLCRNGLRVQKGPDWEWGPQGADAAYGIILARNDGWVSVIWRGSFDQDISANKYRVNINGISDLVWDENPKQPIINNKLDEEEPRFTALNRKARRTTGIVVPDTGGRIVLADPPPAHTPDEGPNAMEDWSPEDRTQRRQPR